MYINWFGCKSTQNRNAFHNLPQSQKMQLKIWGKAQHESAQQCKSD